MTFTELALLITAVTTMCGTLGRGIVWAIQRRSNKTIKTLRSENEWLWAQLLQCEDESDGCFDRLRNLGLIP